MDLESKVTNKQVAITVQEPAFKNRDDNLEQRKSVIKMIKLVLL